MPDTGDFDQGSNNQGLNNQGSNHHDPHDPSAHAGWAGALATLPQETPLEDGWQRLQARLPAAEAPTRQRKRWPLWLAAAASLAWVIAIPLRMQTTTTTNAVSAELAVPTPLPDPVTAQPASAVGVALDSPAIVQAAIEDTNTGVPNLLPAPATTARVRKPRRDRYVAPSQRPIRTVAPPADTTRVASTETIDAPAAATDHDALDSMDALYAQSAQLEGLLSLARDDSVSTGTAAALTNTLSGQIADIDATLARQDASPQERDELWRTRVDILRQLVGIETTQRLYAARGEQYEAALVSID